MLEALNRPLEGRLPTTFNVAEPFMVSFMVSVYAALCVALPVIVWQIWAFLSPAFEEKDQRLVARLGVLGTCLFAGGILFSYFVVLPAATPFLLGFDSAHYIIQIRASNYYSFVAITSIAIGIIFQLPIFLLALSRIGVLTGASAQEPPCWLRALLRDRSRASRRRPGDDDPPGDTVLILFEGSIWLVTFFEKRWAAEAAARERPRRPPKLRVSRVASPSGMGEPLVPR